MGARESKKTKVSRELKRARVQTMQRSASGRSGAWFLEPSGDLHDLEPQDCLKSGRVRTESGKNAIEDSNDEFERDRVGF